MTIFVLLIGRIRYCLVDILDLVATELVTYARMSTPVRARKDSVSRRLQELSTDVCVTGNVCSEANPSHVEESSVLQIEQLCTVEEAKFPELQFSRSYAFDNNKQILVVTQRHLAYHPPFGYVSRVRITFQEDGSYKVHILMQELENGVTQGESEVHELLKRFSATSAFKICPGIEWDYYREHYFEVIRFDIKSVRRAEAPFYRIDSVNCKMWFELPSNPSKAAKNSAEATCSACKRLSSDLEW